MLDNEIHEDQRKDSKSLETSQIQIVLLEEPQNDKQQKYVSLTTLIIILYPYIYEVFIMYLLCTNYSRPWDATENKR